MKQEHHRAPAAFNLDCSSTVMAASTFTVPLFVHEPAAKTLTQQQPWWKRNPSLERESTLPRVNFS